MLKKLWIGLAILMFALITFSIFTDKHPAAVHATTAKLDPVDRALSACEDWTQKNSKLAMGDVVQEYRLTGTKLPANHGKVEVDYRSKGDGVLMQTVCEYSVVQDDVVLVGARSSLK